MSIQRLNNAVERSQRRCIQAHRTSINLGARVTSDINALAIPFNRKDFAGVRPVASPTEWDLQDAHPEFLAGYLGLPLFDEFPGEVVVEVGAGVSLLCSWFYERGAVAIALDRNYSADRKSSVNPVKADGEELPLPTSSVDRVLLENVLCVVQEPAALLREALRVVKNDGTVHLYPAVCLEDPRKILRPGTTFRRWGPDFGGITIHLSAIPKDESGSPDRKDIVRLLVTEPFIVKPGNKDDFIAKRLKGTFFNESFEPDETKLWLGDEVDYEKRPRRPSVASF